MALTYVTPIDAGAIWLFLGVSLVVAAVRGDAGCEAVAIPNAIFRRRDRTGCVAFALVDSLEARSGALAQRRWDSRRPRGQWTCGFSEALMAPQAATR